MIKDRIGRMTQQVQFKMAIKGRLNDTGEQVSAYVTSNEVWAGIEHREAGSGESDVSKRKTDITKVVFTMYFNEAARATWRILYRDAEYEILSVLPDETRFFMEVEAVQQEPWRDDYYASQADGFYTSPSGDYWIAVNRGESQPVFGNLTWTDSDGNEWTTV